MDSGGGSSSVRALIVLMLFAGMAIIVHSVYEEKLARAKRATKVEYRFLPRTLYEEQMSQSDVLGEFKTMFDRSSPWYGTKTS
jgi:hypothetical protein